MNKTLPEALSFSEHLKSSEKDLDPRIQCFLIPPFTAVREVKAALSGTSIKVGAQNMHWAEHGAWTGEISPGMLTDCNLDLVELGHSERRQHFGETDRTVGLKTESAIRHGLIPLICVGETLQDRDSGRADDVLVLQVQGALANLNSKQISKPILFAYEPVWAIGDNGIPATADYADDRHAVIIQAAESISGRRVPCLYGGSVNQNNCQNFISCRNVSGLFIGRSAWSSGDYLNILKKCSEVA